MLGILCSVLIVISCVYTGDHAIILYVLQICSSHCTSKHPSRISHSVLLSITSLVRSPSSTHLEINPPRRVTKPLQLARILGKPIQPLHILLAQINDFQILLNPRSGDGFGEDDDPSVVEVGEEDVAWFDRVFLGEFLDDGFFHQGGAGGAERRVGFEHDARERWREW